MKKCGLMLSILVSLVLLCASTSGCEGGTIGSKQDYKILTGSDFSEGLAWIAGEKENGEQFVGAINSKGKVEFVVDNGKIPKDADTSLSCVDFDNNSGVIKMEDDTWTIVNREGKSLYNVYGELNKSGEYYYIYDANTEQIGIMNGKGEWTTALHTPDNNENDFWSIEISKLSLSGEHLSYEAYQAKANEIKASNRYGSHLVNPIGEGYFFTNVNWSDSNYTIYNAKDNEFINFQLLDEKICGIHALEDQFFIISQTKSKPYSVKGYLFDNTGKCLNNYGTLGEMKISFDNLFFGETENILFDETEGVYYLWESNNEVQKFIAVNKDGKIIFDNNILTNGMKIDEIKVANNGYAGLTTKRGSELYYTVVKSDGTLCFNPASTGFTTSTDSEKKDSIFASEDFGNGMFAIRTDYGKFNMIDMEGNVKKALTFSEDEHFKRGFNDGLAYLSEEKCYIDNQGEIVIKKDPFSENKGE